MTAEQAAYWAGLFDGEGWIRVEVKEGIRGGTGILYVGVGSTDLKVVAKLKNDFGGCLTSQRLSSRSARRISQDWRATNGTALEFLRTVYPYLQIKKRQAALAFKFRKVMDQTLWKQDAHRLRRFKELSREISLLNRGELPGVETVKGTPETEKSQSTVPAS